VGSRGLKSAVADAGPLIHLAEIGAASLLALCERLLVPSAVWHETVGRTRISEDVLMRATTIDRIVLPDDRVGRFIEENGLGTLHRGEQECLYLCIEGGVSVMLTDDLAARDAAQRVGVTPVGSLGVVARAYRLGQLGLPDAERHILALQHVSSLFVSEALIELVLDELRRFSP
jgi:predicted nucleic acid-binding protein